METNGQPDEFDFGRSNREARLPKIDPVTFAALSSLDGFVARAFLSRQEHAEANRSLQHLVQTIEVLQASVKELQRQNCELQKSLSDPAIPGLGGTNAGTRPTIVTGPGGEVFRSLRAEP